MGDGDAGRGRGGRIARILDVTCARTGPRWNPRTWTHVDRAEREGGWETRGYLSRLLTQA